MKKRAAVACLFLLFFLMILLSGCFSQGKDPVTISRFLMDTKVDLTFYNIPHDEAKLLAEDVFAEMARLEELLSAHLENTDIHLLNSRAGKEAVTVSPQTAEVIKKSLELSEQTGGAFDITIAPVLQLWGFGEEKQSVPSPDQLEKALALVDYRNVTFKNSNLVKLEREGMRLDLGGIAKGYIIDQGVAILEEKGIKTAFLNAGGDIKILGSKPDGTSWRVGIQSPQKNSGLLAVLNLKGGAVATSGNYERFFEEKGVSYHHILDPKTGYPARGLAGVTITAPDCMTADALSTAVFVLGLEKGLDFIESFPQSEAVLVTEEGSIYYSSGLEGLLELQD